MPPARVRPTKLSLERLEDRCVPSAATLLKDINTATLGSSPRNLLAANGKVFFLADAGVDDLQLYASDGTAEGTQRLTNAPRFREPSRLTLVGDEVFFTMDDGAHGEELWASDGTAAGTRLVKDVYPDGYSSPRALTAVGGVLYFVAREPSTGLELWRSDGTEAGTYVVKDLVPGPSSGVAYAADGSLVDFGGTLLFTTFGVGGATQLWRSDSTEAGTTFVAELTPDQLHFDARMQAADSYVLINPEYAPSPPGPRQPGQNRLGLLRSDGTAEGTFRLGISLGGQPVVLGDHFYFPYSTLDGYELAVGDGTAGGTRVLKAVANGTWMGALAGSGDTLFFVVGNTTTGYELWMSDGSTAGTVRVIGPKPGRSVGPIVSVGDGTVYLSTSDSSATSLWKSDGTPQGTVLVRAGIDLQAGVGIQVAGTFFFSGGDPAHGTELWRSDGTAAGTALVKDVNLFTGNAFLNLPGDDPPFTAFNGAVFFAAYDAINGRSLWKTDGTTAGTTLVKTSGLGGTIQGVTELTAVGGTLYFVGWDGSLFRSNGTSAGTHRVFPGPGRLRSVNGLTAVGNKLFFSGTDTRGMVGLYCTTGTPAGTTLLLRLGTSAQQARIGNPLAVGGLFYFTFMRGLYRSNGTPEGTVLLRWFPVALLRDFVPFGNVVLFWLGNKLWRTNGTAAGTVGIGSFMSYSDTRITVAGGKAYFNDGSRLWVTNGTTTGTRPLPFEAVARVNWLGTLAFLGRRDGEASYGLWRTNGGLAGSALIKTLPTTNISQDESLAAYRGSLFFTINDSTHGRELWRSDGTEAGTGLFQDVFPGAYSSSPQFLTVVGDRLYFTATDTPPAPVPGYPRPSPGVRGLGVPMFLATGTAEEGAHGREVWVVTLPPIA